MKQNVKYALVFLFGFTIWIPFLFAVYTTNPYYLTLDNDLIWWHLRPEVQKIWLEIHSFSVSAGIGISLIGMFYALYFAVIALLWWIYWVGKGLLAWFDGWLARHLEISGSLESEENT